MATVNDKPKIKDEIRTICSFYLGPPLKEERNRTFFACKDCGVGPVVLDEACGTAGCSNGGCSAPRAADAPGIVAHYEGLRLETDRRKIWARARQVVDEVRELEEAERCRAEDARRRKEMRREANAKLQIRASASGPDPALRPATKNARPQRDGAAAGTKPEGIGDQRGSGTDSGGESRRRTRKPKAVGDRSAEGGATHAGGSRARPGTVSGYEEGQRALLLRWHRATARITVGELVSASFVATSTAFVAFCLLVWTGGALAWVGWGLDWAVGGIGIDPTRDSYDASHHAVARASTAPTPSEPDDALEIGDLGDAMDVEAMPLTWSDALLAWAETNYRCVLAVLVGAGAGVWSWVCMRADRVAANGFGPDERLRVEFVGRREDG